MTIKAFQVWIDVTQEIGGDPRRQSQLWLDEQTASYESDNDGPEEDASGPSQHNLSFILGQKIKAICNDLDAG